MTDIESRIRDAASRNDELLAVLAETDHAVPALIEQDRYIASLDSELATTVKAVAQDEARRKSGLHEHEKYRDSVFRRFAYKATGKREKFDQRAAKEEHDYFDALQHEHQTKEKRKQLDGLRAEALKVRDDLRAARDRHVQAQQELDSLYDAIFQGPTPGFPEEDARERASGDALQRYHDARVRAEAEAQAVRLLGDATRMLQNAQGAMQEALSSSRVDMFGGGAMWDMMERNALSRAEQQVGAAQMMVAHAQQMAPGVRPLPPVRIAQGHILSDVFFDNIFTDMAFHDKIKASTVEVDQCARAVVANLQAAHERHAALTGQMNQEARALEVSRKELQKAREAAFRAVVGERTAGTKA